MLRLVTINIQGLRAKSKMLEFYEWAKAYDIICVQETHWSADHVVSFKSIWRGIFYYDNDTSATGFRGVAILLHPRLTTSLSLTTKSGEGRYLVVSGTVDDEEIDIVNVYLPTDEAERFAYFPRLTALVADLSRPIIAGDFNDVMSRLHDRVPFFAQKRCHTPLHDWAMGSQLLDCWRHKNPFTVQETRSGYVFGRFIRSRIDYIFTSLSDRQNVSNCLITSCPISDHDAVELRFDIEGVKHGPGTWAFNAALLEEDKYRLSIKSIIRRSRSWPEWQNDIFAWYEQLKRTLREHSMFYGKVRAAQLRQERTRLVLALNAARETNSRGLSDGEAVLSASSALKELDRSLLRGAVVRANQEGALEGERPSAYFLRLEKHRQRQKLMKSVFSNIGSIVEEPHVVRSTVLDHFSNHFQRRPAGPLGGPPLLEHVRDQVTDAMREHCDQDVSWEEVRILLLAAPKGKSPGTDGLTNEFWAFVLPLIKEEFLRIVEECIRRGQIPASMKEGMIILLPKSGDLRLIQNWRPITLLNCDYKLLAKIFASRLSSIMPDLVSDAQTGAIRSRSAAHTTTFLHDVIEYTSRSNGPGILLKLDIEKAFDSVSWDYMFNVLEVYGFGPRIRSWIQMFLVGSRSRLKINGFLTDFFQLGRSVRQGCPLSPLLYVLVSDVLCRALSQSVDLVRLSWPAPAVAPLLRLHMDDNTVLVRNLESVNAVLAIYHDFGLVSGARLNLTKCSGLWLGAYRARTPVTVSGIRISSEDIEVLGVKLSSTGSQVCATNWSAKLVKFSRVLHAWRSRSLSILGKVTVVNSLAASTLWHVVRAIPFPDQYQALFRREIMSFIWGSRCHTVAYQTLTRPRADGGFGLVDLNLKLQSLRLQEVLELLSRPQTSVMSTLSFSLLCGMASGITLGTDIFRCTLSRASLSRVAPRQREMLTSWAGFLRANDLRVRPCLCPYNEPLFCNDIIPLSGLSFADRHVFEKGAILRVRDLCYGVVPGFLRPSAIVELCNESGVPASSASILRTLTTIREALPPSVANCGQAAQSRLTAEPVVLELLADGSVYDLAGLSCKKLYISLAAAMASESAGEERWRALFGGPLPKLHFKKLSLPYFSPGMRDINLRVLHNAVLLNHRLFLMHIELDSQCTFCSGSDETIEHILLQCPFVNHFWQWVYIEQLNLDPDVFGPSGDRRNMLIVFNRCPSKLNLSPPVSHSIVFLTSLVKMLVFESRSIKKNHPGFSMNNLKARFVARVRRETRLYQQRLLTITGTSHPVADFLNCVFK